MFSVVLYFDCQMQVLPGVSVGLAQRGDENLVSSAPVLRDVSLCGLDSVLEIVRGSVFIDAIVIDFDEKYVPESRFR